jgi:hypothetical protein
MANAAIAYSNLADAGNLSTSSQSPTMPIANLQNPHIAVKWRSTVNDAYFIVDLLSAQSIDTILVRGIEASVSATIRVRVSLADSSVAVGELADSTALADGSAYFDLDYGALVYTLAAPVTARYVRVDITDSAASYVEAGRLFVGLRTTFTYNYNWGWSLGYTDRSIKIKSRGGQTLVLPDNSFRTITVDFGWVSSAQRYGIVETVDRINGQNTDILLITDTASTNLARDSIWGLATGISTITNPALADIFGKQYQIEERL